MENFEALQNIDNFCKVIVRKRTTDEPEIGNKREIEPSEKAILKRSFFDVQPENNSSVGYILRPEFEEPLIDVIDEEDHIRILVQCRCREQQVTFHPSKDGITICREECHREDSGPERCTDVCRKLSLRTDELQLENMLFVIAKCNNNNTLEAMIPKIRQ